MAQETDLYAPVKALLEGQGYTVKGEVGAADLVAVRGDDDPVIVELKLRFSLALFHQAVARQGVSDWVYIAVPRPSGRTARRTVKDNRALCRRLGLGLIFVRESGQAEVVCDPAPYTPRRLKDRKGRLLGEFAKLDGDPNTGGSRVRRMTGYRQDALRCANALLAMGPSRGAQVATVAKVPKATRMMADNHYGWFVRLERGVYGLTSEGEAAVARYADAAA